jgi:hypothetical protein
MGALTMGPSSFQIGPAATSSCPADRRRSTACAAWRADDYVVKPVYCSDPRQGESAVSGPTYSAESGKHLEPPCIRGFRPACPLGKRRAWKRERATAARAPESSPPACERNVQSAAHLADNAPVQLAATLGGETPPLLVTGPGPLNGAASNRGGQPAVKLRDPSAWAHTRVPHRAWPRRRHRVPQAKAVLEAHGCSVRRSKGSVWRDAASCFAGSMYPPAPSGTIGSS